METGVCGTKLKKSMRTSPRFPAPVSGAALGNDVTVRLPRKHRTVDKLC